MGEVAGEQEWRAFVAGHFFLSHLSLDPLPLQLPINLASHLISFKPHNNIHTHIVFHPLASTFSPTNRSTMSRLKISPFHAISQLPIFHVMPFCGRLPLPTKTGFCVGDLIRERTGVVDLHGRANLDRGVAAERKPIELR